MVIIKSRGSFHCPCGGTFGVTYEGLTDKASGLVHSMPPCERFTALEVTDFLAYVRETKAKRN